MQRIKWLFEDAVTRAPLPFSPSQARLQLLGFLLPEKKSYPAPVEMLAEAGGKRYCIGTTGYAHQLQARKKADLREPDQPVEPGRSIKLGDMAYALSPGNVIIGQAWEIRRELRDLLRQQSTSPVIAMAVLQHLQAQPRRILLARAYAHEGFKGHNNVRTWLDLRERIQRASRPAAPAKPPGQTYA